MDRYNPPPDKDGGSSETYSMRRSLEGFWDPSVKHMESVPPYRPNIPQDINLDSYRRKVVLKYPAEPNDIEEPMGKEAANGYQKNAPMAYTKEHDVFVDKEDEGAVVRECDVVAKRRTSYSSDDNESDDEAHGTRKKVKKVPITLLFSEHGVVINGTVYISKIHWNTLVVASGVKVGMYVCAVCREGVTLQQEREHVELESHRTRLERCPPLPLMAENCVRQINEREVHCGICNLVKTDALGHVTESFHKQMYNFALQSARNLHLTTNTPQSRPTSAQGTTSRQNTPNNSRPLTPNNKSNQDMTKNITSSNKSNQPMTGNNVNHSFDNTSNNLKTQLTGNFTNINSQQMANINVNSNTHTAHNNVANFNKTAGNLANINTHNPQISGHSSNSIPSNSNQQMTMNVSNNAVVNNSVGNVNPQIPGNFGTNVNLFQQMSANIGNNNAGNFNPQMSSFNNPNQSGNFTPQFPWNATNLNPQTTWSYNPGNLNTPSIWNYNNNMNPQVPFNFSGNANTNSVNSQQPGKIGNAVGSNSNFMPQVPGNFMNTCSSNQQPGNISNINLNQQLPGNVMLAGSVNPQQPGNFGNTNPPAIVSNINQSSQIPQMLANPGNFMNSPNLNPQQVFNFGNYSNTGNSNAQPTGSIINQSSQIAQMLAKPGNFINPAISNPNQTGNFDNINAGNTNPPASERHNSQSSQIAQMIAKANLTPEMAEYLRGVLNEIAPNYTNIGNTVPPNSNNANKLKVNEDLSNCGNSNNSVNNTSPLTPNVAAYFNQFGKTNLPSPNNMSVADASRSVNLQMTDNANNSIPIPSNDDDTAKLRNNRGNVNIKSKIAANFGNLTSSNSNASAEGTDKLDFTQLCKNIQLNAVASNANIQMGNNMSKSESNHNAVNRNDGSANTQLNVSAASFTPPSSGNLLTNSNIGNANTQLDANSSEFIPKTVSKHSSTSSLNQQTVDNVIELASGNNFNTTIPLVSSVFGNTSEESTHIFNNDTTEDKVTSASSQYFNTKMARLHISNRSYTTTVKSPSQEQPSPIELPPPIIDDEVEVKSDSEDNYRHSESGSENDSDVYDISDATTSVCESEQQSQEIENMPPHAAGFWDQGEVPEVTNAVCLADFPVLKQPKFSAVAAKPAETSSYANMASRKDSVPRSKRESKYIVVTVARRRYIIQSDHYHCLIAVKEHWYCMACMSNMTLEGKDVHKVSERHKNRMTQCRLMDEHAENMIRWLDQKYIHCAVCNQLTLQHQLENHCRLDKHKRLMAEILAMSSLEKVKRQEDTDRVVSAYLTTLAGCTDEGYVEPIGPLNFEILINVFGSNIKVSSLAYNGMITYEDCYRCVICFDVLQLMMVLGHCDTQEHRANVAKLPFMPSYMLNMIRQLNKKSAHCAICNMMLQNKPEDISAHVGNYVHTNKLQHAINSKGPVPLVKVFADAPVKPPPLMEIQNLRPLSATSTPVVRAQPAELRERKPAVTVQHSQQKERAESPLGDYAETLKCDGAEPYLITHRSRSVLLGSDAWNGVRRDRSGPPFCELCQLIIDEGVAQHKNGLTHNTEIMASQLMESNDREFVREISAYVVQCLTCNKVLSRSALDEHCAGELHASRLHQATLAAEDAPDTVEYIHVDEFTDDNDPMTKTFLVVHNREPDLLVSWACWHALQPSAGALRCLLCSCNVPETMQERHTETTEHVNNVANCHLMETCAPSVVRKLKMKAYHCVTCNMVVQIQQLDNHLKKPSHLKSLQEAQENANNPNTGVEVILFADYVKEEPKEEKPVENLSKKAKKKAAAEAKEAAKEAEKQPEHPKDELQEIIKEKATKETKKSKKEKKKLEQAKKKGKVVEPAKPQGKEKERKKVKVELPDGSPVSATCSVIIPTETELTDNIEELKELVGNNVVKTAIPSPGLLIEVEEGMIEQTEPGKKDITISFETDNTLEIQKKAVKPASPVEVINKTTEVVEDNENEKKSADEESVDCVEFKPREDDPTVRYNLTVVKPDSSSDLNQKYDVPKKILLLKLSDDSSICVSCGAEVNTSLIAEHAVTEDHIAETSKNLAKFTVEVPRQIKKRGFLESNEEPLMYFVQAENSAHSVVVKASAWHCMTEGADVKCMLCDVEVNSLKVEKHKWKVDHLDKLKTLLDEDDGHLIRSVGELAHCITCNQCVQPSELAKHYADDNHKKLLKEALNTTRPNLKITQVVRTSDYIKERKIREVAEDKTRDSSTTRKESDKNREASTTRKRSESESEQNADHKYSLLAIQDEGKKNTARCLACNETVPQVLVNKHLKSKRHAGRLAAVLEMTLTNPLLSTSIRFYDKN